MKKVIDFNRLPKQEYMKPQMKVVMIQQSKMLCGSPGAKGLTLPGDEGFTMPDGGILDDDDDDV